MDTVRSFRDLDVGPIQAYLSKCDAPFETSPLYSTESEETFVDESLRRSVYRSIVDPSLFSLVEDLMTVINEGDDEYQYVLWKNGSDITHIKYEEGGFFKRHRDFTSTTSNLIEEFSLIVCVTPEDEVKKGVEGGQTSIATYGGKDAKPTEQVFDTTTPGSALLFRKDLNHEGKKLLKGVKHIITANLFAVKKTQSEQVLYVTFPDEIEGEKEGGKAGGIGESAATKAIKAVANQTKSYVLPVSRLTGMLEAHVRFVNAQSEGDPPQVVTFLCQDFTYEQFGVVAKVLNRCYVGEDDIEKSQEALNYFGPFKMSNLLVDLAVEPGMSGQEEPPQKKRKEEEGGKTDGVKGDDEDEFDPDVIICENESRMKAVLSTARKFGEPYVPFKILYIEGMLHYCDWDMGGFELINVPMTPAFCSIGDNNNVFALWCLDQMSQPEEQFTLEGAHERLSFFDCALPYGAPLEEAEYILNLEAGAKVELLDFTYGDEYEDFGAEDLVRQGMGLGLNVRVSDDDLKSGLLKYLFNKPERSSLEPLVLHAGLSKETDETGPEGSLFHLDEDGKVSFTRKQAELASDYIADMNLDKKVRASLQKKKFELPQVSEKVDIHYCNDDRYGKMNVLWVCGVLRLGENVKPYSSDEEDSEDSAKAKEFDAWPSEEGNERTAHAKRLFSKYEEIYHSNPMPPMPPKWWEYDSDASTDLRNQVESGE